MKLFVTSAIVVASVSVPASAARDHSLFSTVTDSSLPASAYRGGFVINENFETFSVGQLSPQGGWSSQFDLNASVTDINPIGGQRSARHASDGTSVPGFEIVSPAFDNLHHPVTSTVRLSGTGSTYQLVTRDTTFGFFNTRVSFDPDGRIRIAQTTIDDIGNVGLDFVDTGMDWLVDTDYEVTIETFDDGTLAVDLNGSEIHTGVDSTFILFGIPGGIGQFFVFAGNEGTGSRDGTGDSLTLDGFSVGIPAPGTLAVITLGSVATARRRR